MELRDREYRVALAIAERFLSRWPDRFTANARDDLAQETAVAVWRGRGSLQVPARFAAYVRTVSRRLRCRAIQRCMRRLPISLHEHPAVSNSVVAEAPPDSCLRVDGRWVRKSWLLDQLDQLFGQMTELNRELLRDYYAGRSCSELAVRFGLAEESVKVRLYRARRKLHQEFIGRARRACSPDPAAFCPESPTTGLDADRERGADRDLAADRHERRKAHDTSKALETKESMR